MQPSEIAGSMFEFAVAGERFKKKVLKAHGEVGWNNFQDSEGATIKLAYQDLQLDQLKFDVKNELAIGKLPTESDGLHLIRKDGQWYVDLEATFKGQDKNGGLTADSLAKAFASMSKTIAKYEEKLRDGISIDQLDKEMGAEFLAALVDAGAKPRISVQVK